MQNLYLLTRSRNSLVPFKNTELSKENIFICVFKGVKFGLLYSGKKIDSQIQFRTVAEPETRK
jgi:hypothetical protein